MRKENAKTDFVEIEKQMLGFWEKNACFEKLVKKNENGERCDAEGNPI